ncbi:MAG: hypothetical protein R2991_16295, partial [Thermoanaerobaculia bacterium]
MRPLAWALALLAVLALAAGALLRSDWLASKVRDLAVERASEVLGREVGIDELELRLLPPGAVARGLVVAGDEPGGRPFASARRLEVEADLGELLDRRFRLRTLVVDAPHVVIERRADGSLNVPRPTRQGSGGESRVSLDQLIVRDGLVEVEEATIPLDLEARGLDSRWASGAGPGFELVGDVSSEETTVAIAGLEPYLGALHSRLRLHSGGLEILDAVVRGPDLEASAEGRVLWGEQSRVELELAADATGDLLPRLGLTDVLEGRAHLAGTLTWSPESWVLAGHLASPRLTAAGRSLSGLSAQLRIEPETVRLEEIRGTYRGGALRADAAVALGGDSRTVSVEGSLRGAAVDGVLEDQGLPIEGLAGLVGGPFEYHCTTDDPLAGSGWADLEIQATAPTAAGALPVQGRAPLLIENGVLSSRAIEVRTAPAQARVAGSYDLTAGTGRFDLRSEVSDPGRLLAVLVPVSEGEPTMWRPTAGRGSVDAMLRLARERFHARLDLDFEDVRAEGYSGDRLHGWLALSGAGVQGMRLELSRPQAALVVQGRIPFGEAGVGSALSVQVEAASWPWDDVSAWLPWPLPVTGEVSGSISLAGPPEALDGFVQVDVDEAALAGVPLDHLAVDLGLRAGTVDVRE